MSPTPSTTPVFTWENLIHPDDLAQVMESFDACLSGRAADYWAEYRCRCRNGDYLWWRIVAASSHATRTAVSPGWWGTPQHPRPAGTLRQAGAANRTLEQQGGAAYRRTGAAQPGIAGFQVEETRRLAETDSTGAASRYRLEQAVRLEA